MIFSFGSRSPIGIDVGTHAIKAVQLARPSRKSERWCIESAVSIPRKADSESSTTIGPEEASRLAAVIDRRGFRGRDVVLAVPPQQLMMSMLELPLRTAGVPMDQIARMELARIHQRDAERAEFDQWEIPTPARATKATHVMAVACAHDDATRLLDVIESQGLRVCALDIQPAAAARACAPLITAEGQRMFALLDVGWSACRCSIVHCGVVVSSRSFDDAGLERAAAAIAQRLEVPLTIADELLPRTSILKRDDVDAEADEARPILLEHFDAMLKELNVSFSYAAHQYPDVQMAKLLLTGGGAEVGGLAEHLQARIGLPVCAVKPSELMDCNPDPLCRSAAVVTAIGLAQHDQARLRGQAS